MSGETRPNVDYKLIVSDVDLHRFEAGMRQLKSLEVGDDVQWIRGGTAHHKVVAQVDDDGSITLCDPDAEQLFGYISDPPMSDGPPLLYSKDFTLGDRWTWCWTHGMVSGEHDCTAEES